MKVRAKENMQTFEKRENNLLSQNQDKLVTFIDKMN